MHTNITSEGPTSVLASLRALIPNRPLDPGEAFVIAELQANRLLELFGIDEPAVPEEVIAGLPRLDVRTDSSVPASGLTYWADGAWHIVVKASEPRGRRRFTLAHEFKHIIDHGRADRLYPGHGARSPEEQAEQVADYFAGCLLLPRRLLKRAWGEGIQRPAELARLFDATPRAVEVRLAQVGLLITPRCEPPHAAWRPRRAQPRPRYYRGLSPAGNIAAFTPPVRPPTADPPRRHTVALGNVELSGAAV
jgi:hypothetical protein